MAPQYLMGRSDVNADSSHFELQHCAVASYLVILSVLTAYFHV